MAGLVYIIVTSSWLNKKEKLNKATLYTIHVAGSELSGLREVRP